jgi:hypothetical protein
MKPMVYLKEQYYYVCVVVCGCVAQYVKLYGLQRSGTNLVLALLDFNFDVTVLSLILGNKHDPYSHSKVLAWNRHPKVKVSSRELRSIKKSYLDGSMRYAVVIKNPYSWLVSTQKYMRKKFNAPHHQSMAVAPLGKWVRRWNRHNISWLDLKESKPDQVIVVRYIDLLTDPEKFLVSCEQMGMNRKPGPWKSSFSRRMARAGDNIHGERLLTKASFDPSYYTTKKYRKVYTPALKSRVDRYLKETDPRLRVYIDW